MKCSCRQGRSPPCFCRQEEPEPWWIAVAYNLAVWASAILIVLFVAYTAIQICPLIELL